MICWDVYLMKMACLAALKSKDPSTKVGAVIASPKHEIISVGYNGFPRGVTDSPERYQDRDIKLLMVQHAEANAISASRLRPEGCKIYVPFSPCAQCAGTIIQSGIVEVVLHKGAQSEWDKYDWGNHSDIARQMLEESGVNLRFMDEKLGEKCQIKGERVSV